MTALSLLLGQCNFGSIGLRSGTKKNHRFMPTGSQNAHIHSWHPVICEMFNISFGDSVLKGRSWFSFLVGVICLEEELTQFLRRNRLSFLHIPMYYVFSKNSNNFCLCALVWKSADNKSELIQRKFIAFGYFLNCCPLCDVIKAKYLSSVETVALFLHFLITLGGTTPAILHTLLNKRHDCFFVQKVSQQKIF